MATDKTPNEEIVRLYLLARKQAGFTMPGKKRDVADLVEKGDHSSNVSAKCISAYHIGFRDALEKVISLPGYEAERRMAEEKVSLELW
ncbi:MAG: hypothetical protein PHZ19_00235 [Candidatus Thermoplasmatota archaeon]|nr:hypothetical protein [Candidatus Thermoplasmatota archaeon]